MLFKFSDINECQSSPCENGGICKDFVNGYNCKCDPGYEGPNCEIGETSFFFCRSYFFITHIL